MSTWQEFQELAIRGRGSGPKYFLETPLSHFVLSSWPFFIPLIVSLKNVTFLLVFTYIAVNLQKFDPILASVI